MLPHHGASSRNCPFPHPRAREHNWNVYKTKALAHGLATALLKEPFCPAPLPRSATQLRYPRRYPVPPLPPPSLTPAPSATQPLPHITPDRILPLQVYALRRLARGLTSSRAGARQGYATALAGLLAATGGAGPGGGPLLGPQGMLVLLDVCLDGPVRGGVSAGRWRLQG